LPFVFLLSASEDEPFDLLLAVEVDDGAEQLAGLMQSVRPMRVVPFASWM